MKNGAAFHFGKGIRISTLADFSASNMLSDVESQPRLQIDLEDLIGTLVQFAPGCFAS